MLNKKKHQLIMGKILRDIYADVTISSLLGFKGGTCAYFFYGLPRFSVDLDFDLLSVSEENKKIVLEKIVNILGAYGQIKDQQIKRFTIFSLLSYGNDDHNIKVEINVGKLMRNIKEHYETREYLGILMLVAKKDYMFASKLAALTSRNETAMRDIYDIYYFAKNDWDINAEVVRERTGKDIGEYLADCVAYIEKVKDNQILRRLGELIDSDKEKDWIRRHLKEESIFMLKNYQATLERK